MPPPPRTSKNLPRKFDRSKHKTAYSSYVDPNDSGPTYDIVELEDKLISAKERRSMEREEQDRRRLLYDAPSDEEDGDYDDRGFENEDGEQIGARVPITPSQGFTIDPYIENRNFSIVMILIATIFEIFLLCATFAYYNKSYISGVGSPQTIYGTQLIRSIVVFTILGLFAYMAAVVIWVQTYVFVTTKNDDDEEVYVDAKVRGNRNTWGVMLLTLCRDLPAFILNCLVLSCCGMHHGYQGFVIVVHLIYFIIAFLVSWFAYARLFSKVILGEGIGTTHDGITGELVRYDRDGKKVGKNSSSNRRQRAEEGEGDDESDQGYRRGGGSDSRPRNRGNNYDNHNDFSDRSILLPPPEPPSHNKNFYSPALRSVRDHESDPEYSASYNNSGRGQHAAEPPYSARNFNFSGSSARPLAQQWDDQQLKKNDLGFSPSRHTSSLGSLQEVTRQLDLSGHHQEADSSPTRGKPVARWTF